jgi:hypothetical protein
MPREIRAARPGCAADEQSPAGRCRLATLDPARGLGPVREGALVRELGRVLAAAGVAAGRVLAAAGVAPVPEHPAAASASAVVISRADPGHRRRIVITLLKKR